MYKLGIGDFAKKIGVTPQTLRIWEEKGVIHPERTNGKHRRYTEYNEMEVAKRKDRMTVSYDVLSEQADSVSSDAQEVARLISQQRVSKLNIAPDKELDLLYEICKIFGCEVNVCEIE